MTDRERLEELYTLAYNSDDVCMCLEIADRLRGMPVHDVGCEVDDRVVQFISALDEMVHALK